MCYYSYLMTPNCFFFLFIFLFNIKAIDQAFGMFTLGRKMQFFLYICERVILVCLFYLFVIEKYSTIFFYILKLRFVILTEKIHFFSTSSLLKALLSFCVSRYPCSISFSTEISEHIYVSIQRSKTTMNCHHHSK